ncbi:nitroreductase [Orrella marina]|uniref:Nitrobenzoate reductase n=1 Tax=Orrella marina TaxID=2163011 RepID=A0A2R4XFN7_9BURK|nr:nitroreductase [Orrella marina]AWB32581.1 nitrobenzoate reductase [Orrella marina]
MIKNETQRTVDEVIQARHSMRAFHPTPIAREDLENILEVAARAPSGSNAQPWKVYVVSGDPLKTMSEELVKTFMDPELDKQHVEEYPYYPVEWKSPYQDRRRKVGLDLYKLLGLGREDKDGMKRQHARNFKFFDAPVAMVFTMDKIMRTGSWLDFGCFYQSVMIAAQARGIDSCPQAALNRYHKILRKHCGIPDDEIVLCCLALGYADHSKIENSLVSEREPVSGFAQFIS